MRYGQGGLPSPQTTLRSERAVIYFGAICLQCRSSVHEPIQPVSNPVGQSRADVGGRLASLDGHRAEALDHGAAVMGQGMAPARRQALDVQEVRRIRARRPRLMATSFGG